MTVPRRYNRRVNYRPPQDWSIGKEVRVGFLLLTVTGRRKNEDRYLPDIIELVNRDGVRYEFTPYNGVTKVVEG